MAEGKGGWIAIVHEFPSTMAQNFWIAIFAWTTCFVVTIAGEPGDETASPKRAAQPGLRPHRNAARGGRVPGIKRPGPLAMIVLAVLVIVNMIFW